MHVNVETLNRTALNIASYSGHLDVRVLLDYGANIENIDTEDGEQTPFMEAVEFKKYDVAKLLIERGAKPCIMDKKKQYMNRMRL